MKKIFQCAWCFQVNEIFVDISAGEDQEYTEDCQVCCRPNTIHIQVNHDTLRVEVESEAEG